VDKNFARFAFTPSVKQAQEDHGSRSAYARMEASGDRFVLTEREIPFIAGRDSFYLSTVGENGWPYVQFRGGPKGFLRVLDPTTLAMADFRGNRQYISTGNIRSTRKACLFLIDYPSRQRLKIWAEAEVVEIGDDADLLRKATPENYRAVIERMMVFRVQAYDWNCPQHITPRFTHEEIREGVKGLDPEMIRSCCPDEVKP